MPACPHSLPSRPPYRPAPQKSKLKVTRFLNRLLGMTMTDQELLFQVGRPAQLAW